MDAARQFARVVVPGPVIEPLVYRIPESLQDRIVPGIRVLIPLRQRTVTGVVLETVAASSLNQAKPITAALDEEPFFDARLLQLAEWIAHYYLAPLGEVIAAMLPPNSKRQSQRIVSLGQGAARVTDELGCAVLAELEQHKGKMSLKVLERKFADRSLKRVLVRLQSAGAIQVEDRLAGQKRRSQPMSVVTNPVGAPTEFCLTAEQDTALRAIENRIQYSSFETFLLHGVTGSGKTEVYLRAMVRVTELGRKSLILVPEISLTPQLLDRLTRRFAGKVGVLHSALTMAERWAQWREISRGAVDVVIGARSAVFAPIPDLGLIVVDEEHDPSYKQEEGLRYNGRDLAVVRGKLSKCPVVLGSATPALESYENCQQGRYRLLEMMQRVEQRALPRIQVVDLRARLRANGSDAHSIKSRGQTDRQEATRQLFSEALASAVRENFRDGHQTLIFLNRRGFANFVQCKMCGYIWRCPYCSVTLTLHLNLKRLSCHHCDYRRGTTDTCPECKDSTLTAVGSGTERIEQALKELVPQARVARMDRDTMTRRGSQEELIRRWEKGDIDILVGTQMITKGHDVRGVTLVGAILADLSLNMPDFRAAERTFQLLSQVAGRSGRGDNPGNVIVQTYAPDHYAIQFSVAHDYRGFFAAEREFRRALNYPPFSRLINLRMAGAKNSEVERRARDLAAQLRELQSRKPQLREKVEVLGPAAAPIEKVRNRYRWQVLLRGTQSAAVLELARKARQVFPNARAVRLHIDVDPYSML